MALATLLFALMSLSLSLAAHHEGVTTPDWTRTRPALSDEPLRLHLALRSARWADLETHALRLATPGDPNYGKHLDKDELHELTKPTDETLMRVLGWLDSASIDIADVQGPRMILNATVAQAEALLSTKFDHYASEDGRDIIRTLQYTIPTQLEDDVEMIQPTTRFPQMRPMRSLILPQSSPYLEEPDNEDPRVASLSAQAMSCVDNITPSCLQDLYRFENITLPLLSAPTLGIAGFLDQYASFSDWGQFRETYAPWIKDGNSFLVSGPNPQDSANDNTEANLDIQYAKALAPFVNTFFYSTSGRGPLVPDSEQPTLDDNSNEPWLDHLYNMLGRENWTLPSVMSYSYGENEQSLPSDYTRSVCKAFLELGMRGMSVLVASGDDGPGSSCMSNDGSSNAKFLPTFPASCPWVTTVGGTVGMSPERAARFSGGGFSERYVTVKYGKEAVDGYLKKLGDTHKGYYEPRGRGYPDVAAQSHGFKIFSKGQELTVSGTR